MQLSPHFSIEELTASETAARRGIDNSPPEALKVNLTALAEGLEAVRRALGGRPIHVTSGFRCQQLNSFIGGAKASRHLVGLAADIVCPQFGSPLEVCRAIVAAEIPVDQVIHEFGRWCHVAFPAPGSQAKSQLLTIASAGSGYQPGLHPVMT